MLKGLHVVGVSRVACVAVLAVTAGGCFMYRPADPNGLRAGESVHVELTQAGADEITRQVGPRVASLGGRVIRPRDSTLMVAVRQLTRTRGAEEFWTGDTVSVPLSAVAGITVRRFDRSRTLLTVSSAVIGIVLLRRVVQDAGVFGTPVRPQPGTQ